MVSQENKLIEEINRYIGKLEYIAKNDSPKMPFRFQEELKEYKVNFLPKLIDIEPQFESVSRMQLYICEIENYVMLKSFIL